MPDFPYIKRIFNVFLSIKLCYSKLLRLCERKGEYSIMNNFILSLFFLLLLVLYYLNIGYFIARNVKIKCNKFAFYIIVGWGITFAIGWIVGFPCQLYSKSWYLFATIYGFVLIGIAIVAMFFNVNFKKLSIKKMNKQIIFDLLKNHLKKYWLIYLLACIFTVFSITNLQSYTLNNYTDDHYIVKMVHNLKAGILLQDSQYTGDSFKSYGKFSLALQQNQRMFNTYELVYTFFSAISSISIVTFARFTMTLHNYLIWFFTFQLLGSIFIDSCKSQYSILPFILLLLPAGYSANGAKLFIIRIFENWRNQTAMYMGGSIVRNTAFPILIYLSFLIYKNKKKHCLLFFPLFSITLLSYQTTAISYIILYFPLFLSGFILNVIWSKYTFQKKYLNNFLYKLAFTSIVLLAIFAFINYIDIVTSRINISSKQNFVNTAAFNVSTLKKIYNLYLPYYNNVFKLDFFAKSGFIILIIAFTLTKDIDSKIIMAIISILYIMFRSNKMKLTLSLISLEFYCTPRMLHGMELLIIHLTGIILVLICNLILDKFKKYKFTSFLLPSLSFAIVVSTLIFINTNMNKILKYNKEADGVIKEGYSFLPLTENDKMIPNLFIEVGKYFDNLPGKKYSIYSTNRISYNGLNYTKQYFLISSKKLEYYSPNWTINDLALKKNDIKLAKEIKAIGDAEWRLTDYLTTQKWVKKYSECEKYLKKGNLKYAFFTKKRYKDCLVKYNWKVVLGSDKKGYWLLKRY